MAFTPYKNPFLASNGAKILDKKIINGTIQYQVYCRFNGKRSTNWIPFSQLADSQIAHSYEKRARQEREKNRQSNKSANFLSNKSISSSDETEEENPAKNYNIDNSTSDLSINSENGECNGQNEFNEQLVATPVINECSGRKERIKRTARGRTSRAPLSEDFSYFYDKEYEEIFEHDDDQVPNKINETVIDDGKEKSKKTKNITTNGKKIKEDDGDELFDIKKTPVKKKSRPNNACDYLNFYSSQKIPSQLVTPPRKISAHGRRISVSAVRTFSTSPSPFTSTALTSSITEDIKKLKSSGMVPLEIQTENKTGCVVKFEDCTRLIPKALLEEFYPDEYIHLISTKNSSNKPIEVLDIEVSSFNSPLHQSSIESCESSSPSAIEDASVLNGLSCESANVEINDDDDMYELILSPKPRSTFIIDADSSASPLHCGNYEKN